MRYSLTDDTLIVTYEVTTRDINPEKMSDAEIYNGNVVELFICTTARPAPNPTVESRRTRLFLKCPG